MGSFPRCCVLRRSTLWLALLGKRFWPQRNRTIELVHLRADPFGPRETAPRSLLSLLSLLLSQKHLFSGKVLCTLGRSAPAWQDMGTRRHRCPWWNSFAQIHRIECSILRRFIFLHRIVYR